MHTLREFSLQPRTHRGAMPLLGRRLQIKERWQGSKETSRRVPKGLAGARCPHRLSSFVFNLFVTSHTFARQSNTIPVTKQAWLHLLHVELTETGSTNHRPGCR